jgi:hypothetical protein
MEVMHAATWAFLLPFSGKLWVALVMTAFAVALVMTITGRLSPLGTFDMRGIRRLDTSNSEPKDFVVSNSAPLSSVPGNIQQYADIASQQTWELSKQDSDESSVQQISFLLEHRCVWEERSEVWRDWAD